jgi:predicted dithiol-disulfide oxidoreductase (DUF899 family)
MKLPRVATRDEWLKARTDLLRKEKDLTKKRDRLNTARRKLPMVEVDKDYRFHGPDGEVSLLDMFEGRRQLMIYHFMFAPDWDEGCPSCTAGTDEISDGVLDHLHTRDTTYAMVSRAPLEKLDEWKQKHGWHMPWYSSNGSDFNYDFGVTIDESRGSDSYNYRTKEEFEEKGDHFFDSEQPFEMPGLSCFLRDGDTVYHTYSQYARGLESTGGSYYFLDLTALGRQEEWELPKGRSDQTRPAEPNFRS